MDSTQVHIVPMKIYALVALTDLFIPDDKFLPIRDIDFDFEKIRKPNETKWAS